MTNLEKLLIYVSKLNELVEYPYFFDIGLPTNYRAIVNNGKVEDLVYARLSVGMYLPLYDKISTGKDQIIEKCIFFGTINKLIDHTAIKTFIFNDINCSITWKTLEEEKKRIQQEIFAYLLHSCKIN